MKTVNVLGTEYEIEIHRWNDDNMLKENSWAGYCCADKPLIVIADLDDKEHFSFDDELEKDNYFKACVRHEITHAYLNESGLKDCTRIDNIPWAKNEEMVDWIANQFPKIAKTFEEVRVL